MECGKKSRDSVIRLIKKKQLVVAKRYDYHPLGVGVAVPESQRVGGDIYHGGFAGEPIENRSHYGTHVTVVENPHTLDATGRIVVGPNPGLNHPTVTYSRPKELGDGRKIVFGNPNTISAESHNNDDEGYNEAFGGTLVNRAF